jgi:hypothetical protein
MKSTFLSNLHHAYAQTDGTYAFPNSREGDMLKTAKREIEELHANLVGSFSGYAIMPPNGWDDNYPSHHSLAYTPEGAWHRFCHPSLLRETYEQNGFRAVRVTIEIRATDTVQKP